MTWQVQGRWNPCTGITTNANKQFPRTHRVTQVEGVGSSHTFILWITLDPVCVGKTSLRLKCLVIIVCFQVKTSWPSALKNMTMLCFWRHFLTWLAHLWDETHENSRPVRVWDEHNTKRHTMAHFATPNVFYRPDFHNTTFRHKGVRFFGSDGKVLVWNALEMDPHVISEASEIWAVMEHSFEEQRVYKKPKV